MTKRDYKMIASIIRQCSDRDFESVWCYQSMLVSKLALYFSDDNDRFKSQLFRDTCYGKGRDEEREEV